MENDRDRNEQGLSLALLQFNPSSVVLLDTEGRIRSLNRNAERLLSTTEAEAIGKSYTVVFGESLSQRVFRLMLKGGAEGEARAIEATLPRGRRAKLRATAGPLKDARGLVSGIVFVADEDTSSPKLESLAETQVRLRDALRRYTVAPTVRPTLTASAPATVMETEPNNTPATATVIAAGSVHDGTISPAGDVDFYRAIVPDNTAMLVTLRADTLSGGGVAIFNASGAEVAPEVNTGADRNLPAELLDRGPLRQARV